MALFLAIDAGGSRTTWVLADEQVVLARAETGSIKRMRVPAEAAAANLAAAAIALEAESGLYLRDVTACCVGTAGESVPLVADWIREAIASRTGSAPLLVGDVRIALDAAFQGGAGVLALAGTGSNVAVRGTGGGITTVGGWGPVLGDPGSGYTVGRRALRAAFRALDRGEAPPLLDRVCALWGVRTHGELVGHVYSVPAPDLAALAPLVVAGAAAGDALCAAILQQEGASLGADVCVALGRLPAGGLLRVACAGSILQHAAAVRAAMTAAVAREYPTAVVLPGVVDPVMGALWQARRSVAGEADAPVN